HVALNVHRPAAVIATPAAAWKSVMAAELAEGFTPSGAALSRWRQDHATAADTRGGDLGTSTSAEMIMVSQLEPGHLVRLEEASGWVIVEEVDPVENDPARL